ncbi:hypothetical protein BFU36_10280 [Sulfolobus sp. A20]|uniref:hypothetical protein n=1 Tax=Saccharolobus sp. A20 TaxID=1891280 RepID=UPI000845DE25|nr:hypothetical protein [Sulfolobus sp. A20]TRM77502.1 hypothetical protein DJ532_04280 [Sulfolobus sp. A20-N-F8]TRM82925.1 hypothetical protein DJ531_07750 [Sulfolobus sp. A20-N-F6]TRM89435.1 hypothetical protein DJ529_02365 [Sulfolobus sp. C3]TRM93476.1 hypothetical protein DJ526_03825 [Sulfolobus sp. A20-N-G8]TRN00261.1 hypothetical protein DJ527_07300 [Sulfolobus sp. F1]TRN04145.1 hypothetical protein DJ530_01675 [Sulfolobus sp. E1]
MTYPILLGIDGLSYTSFMKCNPKTLFTLFSSTYRGVVVNRKPQFPHSSWMRVLGMYENNNSFLTKVNEIPPLIKETNAVPINIPISNPTYGVVSLPYNSEISAEEEINNILPKVLESIEKSPVIASITVIDRMLHKDVSKKCDVYKIIDDAVRKIVNKVDDFIIFSVYGEPKGYDEGNHEEHGVFLATIPRPSEHDTVKLNEIGELFKSLVNGGYF